jgi:UDP-N-acetylmuramoyl-tripeptide--D-alanyl-D-alanine ligase
MLWTLDELVAATGGKVIGNPADTFTGVSIDTRTIGEGEIFVAIKGDRVDGHDFAVAALNAGAGIAIVSRVTGEMQKAGALLGVPDTPLVAMEAMGRAARARSRAKIVAVTGSVGKTSTKEMLLQALSGSGTTHASAASFNNHWGVPLTLARLPRDAEFGVFEIGMNHAGEITPLVGMVAPHAAIITTVAASHLGHFNSIDDIAAAKAEIFSGVTDGGAAIINIESTYHAYHRDMATRAGVSRVISFGAAPGADVLMTDCVLHANCTCMTVNVMGEVMTLKLGLPGKHMAQNALAVLAAIKFVGGDLAKAAIALASTKAAKGRGVVEVLSLEGGEFILLDESYNANPASVLAALDLLRLKPPRKHGRRIAVLGDMLELGEQGPTLHREIAGELDQIDLVFACGPLMENLWNALPKSLQGGYAEASSGLPKQLFAQLRPGDVVMIKGSLGSKMGAVADALRARAVAVQGAS